MKHIPIYPACTANACNSGRKPCPCPDACQVSTPTRAEWASLLFWPVLTALGGVVAFVAFILWAREQIPPF